MLIKSLELLLVLTLVIFISILSLDWATNLYTNYKEELSILKRFYEGRVLVKELTEKPPFSNNICNLTEEFFTILSNESLFYNYTSSLGITSNVRIEVYDLLNNAELFNIGANLSDFIEMRRVCSFNNSLYLIILKV